MTDKAVLDGYLEKKGGKILSKWQKRYFALIGNGILYGKNEKRIR